MSASSDYVLNITAKFTDKTSESAKRATKSLGGLASAAKALGAVMAARQIVKYTVELAKVGATAQRQANALDNLASAAGTSGDAIIKAIQGASNYTIDQMTAMQAANRAMVMDVAQTPEAFERLTKVATALGRAMGQDAAKSIDDFVTAAGRQSKMIADNLGLIVNAEDAYDRYAGQIGKTADELTDAEKKQAFLNEMLTQGEAKMADLGDQSLDAAGSIEQLGAAAADAKTSLGIIVSTMVQATGIVPKLATETRRLADDVTAVADAGGPSLKLYNQAFRELFFTMEGTEGIQRRYLELLRAESGMYDELGTEIGRYAYVQEQSAEIARYGHSQVAEAAADEAAAIKMTADERNAMLFAMHQTNRAQEELASTTPPATRAIEDEGEAAQAAKDEMAKLAQVAADFAGTQLDLSMRFTSQLGSMEEEEKELAARRERVEAEHQEKMAEIRRRGQATAISIDAAAEQEKLAQLQRSLEIAVQSESEMSEKTKQSTRMRKEDQIAGLQTQIAEQEKLLDDHAAGRLVRQGQNTDALIAEEQRRHEATIATLDAEMAKQEEIQQKALGNMTMNAFDAWAKNQEAMGKSLDPTKVVEMRTKIAEEFGLVEKGAAELITDMMGEWDAWAENAGENSDAVVDYMGAVLDATEEERKALMELTAQTWWIRVRYEINSPPVDIPGRNGGGDAQGMGYGGGVTNNNMGGDTYIFNTPHGPAAVLESQRRARRRQMGRIM
jgi:hypothetical protein